MPIIPVTYTTDAYQDVSVPVQISPTFTAHQTQKENGMKNILLTIGIVMVFAWAVGLFAFSAGPIIHFLLAIGIISAIVGLVPRSKAVGFK